MYNYINSIEKSKGDDFHDEAVQKRYFDPRLYQNALNQYFEGYKKLEESISGEPADPDYPLHKLIALSDIIIESCNLYFNIDDEFEKTISLLNTYEKAWHILLPQINNFTDLQKQFLNKPDILQKSLSETWQVLGKVCEGISDVVVDIIEGDEAGESLTYTRAREWMEEALKYYGQNSNPLDLEKQQGYLYLLNSEYSQTSDNGCLLKIQEFIKKQGLLSQNWPDKVSRAELFVYALNAAIKLNQLNEKELIEKAQAFLKSISVKDERSDSIIELKEKLSQYQHLCSVSVLSSSSEKPVASVSAKKQEGNLKRSTVGLIAAGTHKRTQQKLPQAGKSSIFIRPSRYNLDKAPNRQNHGFNELPVSSGSLPQTKTDKPLKSCLATSSLANKAATSQKKIVWDESVRDNETKRGRVKRLPVKAQPPIRMFDNNKENLICKNSNLLAFSQAINKFLVEKASKEKNPSLFLSYVQFFIAKCLQKSQVPIIIYLKEYFNAWQLAPNGTDIKKSLTDYFNNELGDKITRQIFRDHTRFTGNINILNQIEDFLNQPNREHRGQVFFKEVINELIVTLDSEDIGPQENADTIAEKLINELDRSRLLKDRKLGLMDDYHAALSEIKKTSEEGQVRAGM